MTVPNAAFFSWKQSKSKVTPCADETGQTDPRAWAPVFVVHPCGQLGAALSQIVPGHGSSVHPSLGHPDSLDMTVLVWRWWRGAAGKQCVPQQFISGPDSRALLSLPAVKSQAFDSSDLKSKMFWFILWCTFKSFFGLQVFTKKNRWCCT